MTANNSKVLGFIELLHFNREDLEYNRQGVLSPGQKKRLMFWAKVLLIIMLILLVIIIAGIYGVSDNPLTTGQYVVMGIIWFLLPCTGFFYYLMTRKGVTKNQVKRATGKVSFKKITNKYITTNYLMVEGYQISIPCPSGGEKDLSPDKLYSVYYLDTALGEILSIEEATKPLEYNNFIYNKRKATIKIRISILVIGIILTISGVILFARPVTKITGFFAENGIRATGTVVSKNTTIKTFHTRYGNSDIMFYEIIVSYHNKDYNSTIRDTVRDLVSKNEYDRIKSGDKLEILYLPLSIKPDKGPGILLSSTVGSTFFHKIMLCFHREMTDSALGLVSFIFGLLGIFLGILCSKKVCPNSP